MSPEPAQHSTCVNKWHITASPVNGEHQRQQLSPYHRQILSCLSEHGGAMSAINLAQVITTARTSSKTNKSVQESYLELVTIQLPLLENEGLVEYCDHRGVVTLNDAQ